MKFLNKLERKFGRYAIPNLSLVIIIAYAAGYIIEFTGNGILDMLTLNPYLIMHGQIWRLITWVIVPPEEFDIFTLIMLFFYYSIGTSLERTWGTFRYNVYIFSGILMTVVGALLMYGVYEIFNIPAYYGCGAEADKALYYSLLFRYFSTYYINLSIFLAFAASYPDMQVLLYFIIPIKIKWMAYLDVAFLAFQFIMSGWPGRVAIVVSLLNFIIFFFATRNYNRVSPREIKRKQAYRRQVQQNTGLTRHKCAICGRTEKDDDTLEFRFCSKCDGNYEYCQEHLFTHQHVKK